MKYLILNLILATLFISCTKSNKSNSEKDFVVDAQVIGRTSICSDEPDRLIMQIKVSNGSNISISFWIYKCSWEDSFIIDRNDVQFSGRECVGNYPVKIDLKPSESIVFVNTIKLLSDSLMYNPTTFKIGLISFEENELKGKMINGIPEDQKTYWSKPIKMDYSQYGYNKHP